MGTRISEDLRGPDPSDIYTPYEETFRGRASNALMESIRDPNSYLRSPIKRSAQGIANWLGDWSEGYQNIDEQAMRDKSWGDRYSPREALYDLTGGRHDIGGQIHDVAALGLNIPSELIRFSGAGLAGLLPWNLKHGFGKGTGYGLDVISQGLLGTPDMWEDNPLRFQHPGWNEEGTKYDFHESYAPYMDEAVNEYLPDLMTRRAEEDINKRTNDLVDRDTFFYENPDATEQDYKKAWSDANWNLQWEKYGDQVLDYADKNYKKEMMDEHGIYNPMLLQGLNQTEMEEAMGDMGLEMELGILYPMKNYMFGPEGYENPWFDYSSPEAQEKMYGPQLAGEMVGGFGIPAAARSLLRTGVKYGMPKAMERGIKEAFPGTTQLFGRGEAGIPRLANDRLWKKFINRGLIAPVDFARPWGGQFATVGTIAEMMDED